MPPSDDSALMRVILFMAIMAAFALVMNVLR